MQVIHIHGPITESHSYFAFGLEHTSLNSTAAAFGKPLNKYLYNKGSELQSKEFSDGSGLDIYDTHFRQLDPQLGRWWQIDPKPDYSQSLYSSMNNNPISFNDPLGDTVRVGETITSNKLLNSAFNVFAGSKAGIKYLSKFAAKGQTIGGHTYNKDGKYSKGGVDLNYKGETNLIEANGGNTITKVDEAGRGQINISINSNFSSKTVNGLIREAFDKIGTMTHESFIHGELSAKDFLDNKKFDYSNISAEAKNLAGYSHHYQHYQVLLDMRKGFNNGNLWPSAAVDILKPLNDRLKVYQTDGLLTQHMWDYQGGINLDENGKPK